MGLLVSRPTLPPFSFVLRGGVAVSLANQIIKKNLTRPISACLTRQYVQADTTFPQLENNIWLNNLTNCVGKTSKEASTLFYSVVKPLGSSGALEKYVADATFPRLKNNI